MLPFASVIRLSARLFAQRSLLLAASMFFAPCPRRRYACFQAFISYIFIFAMLIFR